MFEIEKDIPVVPRQSASAPFVAEVKEALAKMEPGDSFAYQDATPSRAINRTVRAIAKTMSVKVTVRRLGDGKFRVWKLS